MRLPTACFAHCQSGPLSKALCLREMWWRLPPKCHAELAPFSLIAAIASHTCVAALGSCSASDAGITIAQAIFMRLTEILTIYLAIGAPFGVARFFDARSGSGARVLLEAIGSALAWPVTALRLSRSLTTTSAAKADAQAETVLGLAQLRARGAFEEALRRVEETESALEKPLIRRDFERSLRALLSAIDQHYHLRSALQKMSIDAAPVPLAVELCRLSGRAGDDLAIAAACIHRQNKAHLNARCAQSADELIAALKHFQITADEYVPDGLVSYAAQLAHRQTMLTLYCLAVELLSWLDDRTTAVRAGRFVDVECAKLRLIEQRGEQAGRNEFEVNKFPAPTNHSTLAPVP